MTGSLELKVKLALDDLKKGIGDSKAEIKKLDQVKAQVRIDLASDRLQGQIGSLKKQLAELDSQVITPEIEFKKDEIIGSIANVKRQLLELDKIDIKPKINFKDYLEGGSEKARDLATQFDVLGTRLDAAGQKLNQFSGAAIAAFAQFDSAKAKVSTLTDDTDGLTASLSKLSGDLKNQASTTELLNASYDVLSSGFSKTADATKILEASTKGAIGGFSDTGTVADALTSTLNAYSLGADQATIFTDKFIQVQNAGKITVDEYAKKIGSLAPTAALAGVSIDSLNGFISTATFKGVNAEATFSGLRQAIAATLKPSDDAAKLAAQLGIQFDASALKTKGLEGILGELNARGLDTSENLFKLFGSVEAVTAIAPSAGKGFKLLTENIEGSKNAVGLANAAFEKISNSFEGRLKSATNEANNALVSLGGGAAEAITPLLGALEFLVKYFNALPEPVKKGAGAAIAAAGGLLTLAGGIAAVVAILPALTVGFGVISAGATTFLLALVPIAPLLPVIAAGLAAFNFIRFTKDLEEGNQALDEFASQADRASTAALSTAQKIANANNKIEASQKSKIGVTKEQIQADKDLLSQAGVQLDFLKNQLKAAQDFVPVGEEQTRTQQNLIATYKISIGALESQSGKLKTNLAAVQASTAGNKDQAKTLSILSDEYDKANKALDLSTAQQIAKAKQAQASQTATAQETQAALAKIEQDGIEKRIALNMGLIAKLGLIAGGKDIVKAKEAQAKIIEIETQTAQLRGQLSEKQIAEEQRIGAERVKVVERTAAEAKDVTDKAEQDRVNSTLAIQLKGYASQATLREQQLNDERKSLDQRLADQAKYIADLEKLPKPTKGSDEAIALENKIQAAKLVTGKLQGDITKNEIAQQQVLADKAIEVDQVRREALQNESKLLSANNSLREATVALEQSLTDAATSRADREVKGISEATELQKQLGQLQAGEGEKRQLILERLAKLGFDANTTELQFAERKAAKEQELATLREKSFNARQAAERAGLESDIQRQSIAQRILEIEANIAVLKAGKDATAIGLAQQQVQLAKDLGATLTAEAQTRRETLGVQQASAKEQFQADQSQAAFNSKLEVADARFRSINASATDLSANIKGATASVEELAKQGIQVQGYFAKTSEEAQKLSAELGKAKSDAMAMTQSFQLGATVLQDQNKLLADRDVLRSKQLEGQVADLQAQRKQIVDRGGGAGQTGLIDVQIAQKQAEIDRIKSVAQDKEKANLQQQIKNLDEQLKLNQQAALDTIRNARALSEFSRLLDSQVYVRDAQRQLKDLGLPQFAGGVENFGGGLAIVHKDELLVNLSRGTSVIPANEVAALSRGVSPSDIPASSFASRVGQSASNTQVGTTVQGGINLYVQPDEVQRQLANALLSVGRRN